MSWKFNPFTSKLDQVIDGVTSLNGMTGAVTLAAGSNITLTPAGNILTISSTGGGGGTPGGSNTQLQYNNSGSFGGIPQSTWDGDILTLSGANLNSAIIIQSGNTDTIPLVIKNIDGGGVQVVTTGQFSFQILSSTDNALSIKRDDGTLAMGHMDYQGGGGAGSGAPTVLISNNVDGANNIEDPALGAFRFFLQVTDIPSTSRFGVESSQPGAFYGPNHLFELHGDGNAYLGDIDGIFGQNLITVDQSNGISIFNQTNTLNMFSGQGVTISATGNFSFSSGVDTTFDVGGSIFLSPVGSTTINSGGDFNVQASAGSINFEAGGNIIFNGDGTASLSIQGVPDIFLETSNLNDSIGIPGNSNDILTSLGGSGGVVWKSAASLGLLTSIPWATPGTIGSTTPNTGAFTTLVNTTHSMSGLLIKYNNVNTSGYGTWVIRARNNQSAQTTGQTICTFTPGATGSFIVTGYLNITAVSLDVIKITVTYKDENGASQTLTPLSGLAAIGNNGFTTGEIRCNNTVITVASTLTTGTGSITYDQGAGITQVD